MFTLDRDLFYVVNGWPDSWSPFFKFLSAGIDEWPVRIALLLLIVGLSFRKETRRGALIAGLLWPIANEVTDLFKKTIPIERPCQVLPDVVEHIGCGEGMGTVSGHSANMMFVAVVFTASYGWKGSPWLLVAVLVGISRVYVGAHYPSQVVMGMAVGAFMAFVAMKTVDSFVKWRQSRLQIDEPESAP
jgi:undecaprenyl-diphosphatase